MKKIVWLVLILALLLLVSCGGTAETSDDPAVTSSTDESTTEESTTEEGTSEETTLSMLPIEPDTVDEGLYWPKEQALPWFAEPASIIDCVSSSQFGQEELLSIVALQGMVNKTKPSLAVLSDRSDALTWLRTTGKQTRQITVGQLPRLLKNCIGDVSGVVLYSTERSNHYRNLALTAAAVKNAIPMTQETYDKWKGMGVQMPPVVDDLTKVLYTAPVDIYTYLYDNYWKDCTKRVLISLTPDNTYNLHDYASALGAATVYLDCMTAKEKELFNKFLKDMTPGEGVVLGWFTSERSGITTVAENGLTTVPADFFDNATIFSGVPHTVKTAGIPDMPKLENKVYVMAIVSDGDNIQYNQHAMMEYFNMPGRGKVALNWTISPALVDIAPNILNYYYKNATDSDCLICGPSGYGYVLMNNTLWEPGANVGNHMPNPSHVKSYVELTNRYLGRSGLRVVTIWDNATDSQLKTYTKDADYLWGLTVQDWNNPNAGLTQVVNGMLVQQLVTAYSVNMDSAYNAMGGRVKGLSKNKPHFLALQFSVWEDFSPEKVAELEKRLQALNPNVEFVRADHFYALYNQANGLAFDLSILPDLEVAAEGNSRKVALLTDGILTNLWEAPAKGEQTVTLSLGAKYDLTELRLYHASEARKSPSLNTVSYALEVSSDGETYTRIMTVENNTEGYNKLALAAEDVTHLRIVILDGGADGIARLADIELYGKVAK